MQRVAFFLSNLSPKFIKWPSDEEKLVIATEFAKNDFLNVIGAIDGCHIRIDKPIEDPNSYMNRKGFYSIHVLLFIYLHLYVFHSIPVYNYMYFTDSGSL